MKGYKESETANYLTWEEVERTDSAYLDRLVGDIVRRIKRNQGHARLTPCPDCGGAEGGCGCDTEVEKVEQ